MKYVKWSAILVCLLPLTAFAFYKPSRVMVPQVFGVHCGPGNICVDDPARLGQATALFNAAREYLHTRRGLSVGTPRMIFCSTARCQSTFGHERTAGYTLGTFGIIIQPRGWKKYYVAHELIHYWQAENFGSLALLRGKRWVVEGMAYDLSGDPRKPLHEPFESYRRRFAKWYSARSSVPLKESLRGVL